LKIESESGILFSTISGQLTSQCSCDSSEDVIEMNGLFAAKQGFKNGQVVGVHCCCLIALILILSLVLMMGNVV